MPKVQYNTSFNEEINQIIEDVMITLAKWGYLPTVNGEVSRYIFTKFCILSVAKSVLQEKKRREHEALRRNKSSPPKVEEDEHDESTQEEGVPVIPERGADTSLIAGGLDLKAGSISEATGTEGGSGGLGENPAEADSYE